jgi:hypothetical protein
MFHNRTDTEVSVPQDEAELFVARASIAQAAIFLGFVLLVLAAIAVF